MVDVDGDYIPPAPRARRNPPRVANPYREEHRNESRSDAVRPRFGPVNAVQEVRERDPRAERNNADNNNAESGNEQGPAGSEPLDGQRG